MKKIALFFFFIVFAYPFVVFGQTTTPQTDNTSLTIIGDSLTTDEGAGTKLKQAFTDIHIDAEVGRSWPGGLTELNNLVTSDELKDVLVFALGTNNGITQININDLISIVPDKKIVLMTIYRGDVDWDDDANTLIRNAATSNPNIKVADWNTMASAHPEWFGPDGTHPTTTGYSALADLIIQAVNSSMLNPTTPPSSNRSNCVITKVGNPAGVAPVCPTDSNQNNNPVIGPCGPLLTWAQTINDRLELGAPDPSTELHYRYHNRQMNNIYNCNYSALKRDGQATQVNDLVDERINHWYWCTYIVIDSFNLTGVKGLSGEALDLTQADVRDLHIFMDSTPGMQFVDYRTNKKTALSKVRPGYAFFVESCFRSYCAGGAHTGIINSINIDNHGNGTIITLESNNTSKSHTWPVAEWEVIEPDYAGRPLVGFGGPI